MSVFKVKKSVKNYEDSSTDQKLMWVYLDKNTRAYLSLMALNSRKGRSRLIGEILKDWVGNFQDEFFDSESIEISIAQDACLIFEDRWESGYYPKSSWESKFERDRVFEEFVSELKVDLRKRGIVEEDISKIIQLVYRIEKDGPKNKQIKRTSKSKSKQNKT